MKEEKIIANVNNVTRTLIWRYIQNKGITLNKFCLEAKHTFMHIPKEKRVKTHVIKRDQKVIEAIKTRIEECREYYNNLIEVI